jgi:site-specific recombinase XerD
MAIRKHPTKGPDWWQIVISRGRSAPQRVIPYQGTEAEAKAFEAEVRGIPAERTDCRVVDLLGRFLDWYMVHRAEKTVEECKRAFKRLLPHLGDKYLTLLRQIDYERYKAARLGQNVSRRTINIELTYFRAYLAWARDNGHQPGADPQLFEKKYCQPKCLPVLTAPEADALLGQLQGDKRTLAQLMAWCGLRRNEALQLTREQVDLAGRSLIITGKMHKIRQMPIIGAELEAALKEACKGKKPGDYLFINPRTKRPYLNIKRELARAGRKAGLDKQVGNHLLRHSFGTAAVMSGVNLRSLQTMLGHSDIRTTEIYTHMSHQALQLEAAKLRTRKTLSAMSDSKPAAKAAKTKKK